MKRHVIAVLSVLLALVVMARAQCDSVPPLLVPAFTLAGPQAGDAFGLNTYVIHDNSGKPSLAISTSGSGYFLRVYDRIAGATDTSYRCCLMYTEAHECHLSGSRFPDWIVHQHAGGQDDSIFFIPGSPEGIWSERRWLLMTPAAEAQIAVGRFFDSTKDGIAIGDLMRGVRGSLKLRTGEIWLWKTVDSVHATPDTILVGDTSTYPMTGLGIALAAGDIDGDGFDDLVAASGSVALPDGGFPHGLHVFRGGAGFPRRHQDWRDRGESNGSYFYAYPYFFPDRSGRRRLFATAAYVNDDSAWGETGTGWRMLLYGRRAGDSSFDTLPIGIWRPPAPPNRTCVPGMYDFGANGFSVGDVNGDGGEDVVITAQGASGDGPLLLYLGGTELDTIPDAYAAAGARALGGIDWNGDSLGDLVIPVPNEPGQGGSIDQPKGAVKFFSGSRALRSFGVDRTEVSERSLPQSPFITVYPQPARAFTSVVLPPSLLHRPGQIRILDMLGRVVEQRDLREGTPVLSLHEVPPGVLYVEAVVGGSVLRRSFVHIR